MIARKPKVSMIALALALLIAALAVGCAFSGAREMSLPKLSDDIMTECMEAWQDSLNHNPKINASTELADPENQKDGIRYYGSFTDAQGIENHILFIPIHDYDVSVDLDVGGQHFTHRSSFALYTASYDGNSGYYLLDGVVYRPDDIPKDSLDKAAKIHQQYEKMIYGSVLKDTTPRNEAEAKLQAEAAFVSMSSYRLSGSCELCYGVFDGYSVLLQATGAGSIETKQIGSNRFLYPSSFQLVGYKDGKFHNIENLYQQGKISDESLSKLAQLHKTAIFEKFDWLDEHFT